MPRSRSKNMNHCGQSPSGFWLREHAQQQVAHRRRCGRARAAARRAPGRRRACPSRRRSTARGRAARGSGSSASWANQGRISCERATASARRAGALQRRAAPRHAAPEAPRPSPRRRARSRRAPRSAAASPISWPVMRSPTRCAGAVTSTRNGCAARAAVREQQLVAADALDHRAGVGVDAERSRRESAGRGRCRAARATTMPSRVARRSARGTASAPSSPLSATWLRDQEAARRARRARRPRATSSWRSIAAQLRTSMQAARVLVDPAAAPGVISNADGTSSRC